MPLPVCHKSYHKTASLICDACKSCAILGGHASDSVISQAAEEYGYHLGLAYQIIDDVLDFTSASDVLGKPALADVSLGLSTAPVSLGPPHTPWPPSLPPSLCAWAALGAICLGRNALACALRSACLLYAATEKQPPPRAVAVCL